MLVYHDLLYHLYPFKWCLHGLARLAHPNHAKPCHMHCPHAEDKTMVQTEEVKDAHDLTLGWGHGKSSMASREIPEEAGN